MLGFIVLLSIPKMIKELYIFGGWSGLNYSLAESGMGWKTEFDNTKISWTWYLSSGSSQSGRENKARIHYKEGMW